MEGGEMQHEYVKVQKNPNNTLHVKYFTRHTSLTASSTSIFLLQAASGE
jgi:hypothetical protein